MPHIHSLTLYPIKSCAGIALEQAQLTAQGLVWEGIADRQWMLVDEQGRFLTQRSVPHMARIRPGGCATGVQVDAPGMPTLQLGRTCPADAPLRTVQVWDDTLDAIDEGDAAATWMQAVLGLPCRLVRFPHSGFRAASRTWTKELHADTRFADAYPLLLIGQSSLDDLNARLHAAGREALPMNRFRPNLVLAGLPAYEEDYVLRYLNDEKRFALRGVKPCTRCTIPSVEQSTGIAGPDPMDILRLYRADARVENGITFGMNLIVERGTPCTIAVGDTLSTELDF
jgi:uncharacterized protein YcbX